MKRALVGFTTAAVALGLMELGVRAAVPERTLLFHWEQPDGLLALTQELHAQVPPNVERSLREGPDLWRVRTNSQALREDHDIPASIPRGERRILALGDSWIYGWSIDQGSTISAHLEAMLPERLGVDRVQVVNGGVPFASSLDMLLRWRDLSPQLDLDGVLLATSHNTMKLHLQREHRAHTHVPNLGAPRAPLRSYMLIRRLLVRWTRPAAGSSLPPAEDGSDTSAMMRQDMAQLASEIQDRGLAVWYLQLPDSWFQPESLKRLWSPTVPDLHALGVPMAGHSLEQRSCWGVEDSSHPSAAGGWALAVVAAELIATGQPQQTLAREPSCDQAPVLNAASEPAG